MTTIKVSISFCIYISYLVSTEFAEATRDIGLNCQLDNNDNCFFTNEADFNMTCCTPNEPCGILQGGCNTDEDCFANLECVPDTCGLPINGTKCCQTPGRKPS